MTYQVRVTFKSGMVIKGITDTHPVTETGNNGQLVTLRLTTKEWKDSRHMTTEEWDTIVNMNMNNVIMVQCRKVPE